MLRVQVFPSIQEIGSEAWSALADSEFPFSSYQFLAALESGDCLGARTGWFPQFVVALDGEQLLGSVILYIKTNSYGEYIFDFPWADAFERSHLSYFPKLTSAIPFTPATGPKLLLAKQADPNEVTRLLQHGVDELASRLQVSSQHALFLPATQLRDYEQAGYFLRHTFQYHWLNDNYKSFADFTAKLRGKRRKEILRERAKVRALPIRIQRLTGDQLTSAHGDTFYDFYLRTIDKRNSFDYLTRAFFRTVFTELRSRVMLVLAEDDQDRPVAGALNFFGEQTLFGRNWGCLAEYKHLHFELCYYQGIEFAIDRGLARFEAGAQGEHKFQRGFLPAVTYSAHKIYHPQMSQAIRDHVTYERAEIARVFAEYERQTPFK